METVEVSNWIQSLSESAKSGFRLEKKATTLVITLVNPPANTWTVSRLRDFKDIITKADQDSSIWSLVVTGEGDKFFCAGADLNQFADGDKGHAALAGSVFGEAFEALSVFNGLTIAAVNGYAMGGGLEVALACDFRILEERATVGLPEARVGLLPCAGGTQNLTRLAGESVAKRVILLGEHLKADKALACGVADAVVEQGTSVGTALEWCERSTQQSPVSVAACKALIQNTRKACHADGLVRERDEFVKLFDYVDTTEGVNAFLEKRKPSWKNG